jgi:gliding motility-associated-like protein
MWHSQSITQSGNYQATLQSTSGCDSVVTLHFSVVQSVTGSTDSITVCANALPYQWNNISITSPGTYKATLKNIAGCDSVVTLVFATSPVAAAGLSGGNPICPGQTTTISINLTGTPPWSLTYSDGTPHTISGIMSTPYVLTVSPVNTTVYSLVSVSDVKCSNNALSSSVTVTVYPSVKGIRYPTVTASANVAKLLQARDLGTNYTYNWNPPTGLNYSNIRTPVFKYDRSLLYLISLTPDAGCKVVDTLQVLVSSAAVISTVHVPNLWSPNADGHNDRLYPLMANVNELRYFRVFNRWGQLMFETNKPGEGWDGIFNGKPQLADLYTWTLEAVGHDGVVHKQSGNSILIR